MRDQTALALTHTHTHTDLLQAERGASTSAGARCGGLSRPTHPLIVILAAQAFIPPFYTTRVFVSGDNLALLQPLEREYPFIKRAT